MPRKGRSTKACQTDPVILSEQDVEKIVTQQVSDLHNHVKRLEDELKELKSTGVKNLSSLELDKETAQIKTDTEKLAKYLDSLNNLQQAVEVSVEQLQEQLYTV